MAASLVLSPLTTLVPDAASAQASTAAVGPGRYENTDPATQYTGTWTTLASSLDSGGSNSTAYNTSSVSLTFTGPQIQWISRKTSGSGIAAVFIDGALVANVDRYSATAAYQQVLFSRTNLSAGTHTIRIEWTGKKSDAATGTGIVHDAFVVPDITPPDPVSEITSSVSSTTATVRWTASPSDDVAGYRLEMATNSETDFRIVSTSLITGTSATTPTPVRGAAVRFKITAVDTSGNISTPTISAPSYVPVLEGRYENTSPTISFDGPWRTTSTTGDSGGSIATVNAAATASLTFEGPSVSILARTGPTNGIASITIDGGPSSTVDLYSPTSQAAVSIYSTNQLSNGTHTITISWTGTTNNDGSTITLDAIHVADTTPPPAPPTLTARPTTTGIALTWDAVTTEAIDHYTITRTAPGTPTTATTSDTTWTDTTTTPGTTYTYALTATDTADNTSTTTTTTSTAAVGPGRYENTDPATQYTGTWTTYSSSVDSGGSDARTNSPGTASLAFTGPQIRYIARTGSSYGIASVAIDGVKVGEVDLYSASSEFNIPVFEKTDLSHGAHTITITRTGQRNAASSGSSIVLDAFDVPDITPPAPPTSVTSTSDQKGITVAWSASTSDDVAEYRVYRESSNAAPVPVETVSADQKSLRAVEVVAGTAYSYRVSALDASGNESSLSSATTSTYPSSAAPSTANVRYTACPAATVTVSTTAQFKSALATARPGTTIRLAPGVYNAPFDVTTSGTKSSPIWICGPRSAVIQGADLGASYGMLVRAGVSYVNISGMTVTGAAKGIMVVRANHLAISDVDVHDIGNEAIHLRTFTTDSTVVGNVIARTGLRSANWGEGIYIGSSQSNWCSYSSCLPDASDRNVIIGNTIRDTAAEPIEAKEGTTGGLIAENNLDGAKMTAGDALVAVQGTDWLIRDNTGGRSPLDGVHATQYHPDFGYRNVAVRNVFTIDNPAGFSAKLDAARQFGNQSGCSNKAAGAPARNTNLVCQG